MRPDIEYDRSGPHEPRDRRGERAMMLLRRRLEEMGNDAAG